MPHTRPSSQQPSPHIRTPGQPGSPVSGRVSPLSGGAWVVEHRPSTQLCPGAQSTALLQPAGGVVLAEQPTKVDVIDIAAKRANLKERIPKRTATPLKCGR